MDMDSVTSKYNYGHVTGKKQKRNFHEQKVFMF